MTTLRNLLSQVLRSKYKLYEPIPYRNTSTYIKMSDCQQNPEVQELTQIIDNSNLDCSSGNGIIAKSFQAALTNEDIAAELEPPLKGLTDDFGKWHPIQLPPNAAPLTIQRAVTLLSRPVLKQRPARRKSLGALPPVTVPQSEPRTI